MKSTVSVVVITKNEERNIAACLASVAWADEIILVDSFSDDNTVAIARNYTDKIVQKEWPGMVGTQRNVGLTIAEGKWVLFLDADERVTEELRKELHALVTSEKSSEIAAGLIPRKNFFFGKWLKSSYPDYTQRLLKKGVGAFNEISGHGFDTLVVEGRVISLKNPLLHLTGETLAQRVRKLDFDSGLQADEKFRAGEKVGGFGILMHSLFAFFRVYVLKKSVLEGTRGLIYACLASFNTFMKYAKLWERCQSGK